MLEMTLPALPGGAATVLRWLVGEGAEVASGAPLVIMLTECVEVVLPAPAAGTLADCTVAGARVEPGGALGRLVQPPASALADVTASAEAGTVREAPPALRFRATPLARKIALAHGIVLPSIAGTGPAGCIRAADIRAALGPHSPPPPLPHSPCPPVPIATATVEYDASTMLQQAASLAACVIEAAAELLPEHPTLNGRWGDEMIVLRRRLHVAVAEPGSTGGLRWALVRDAGDLTLRGVARAIRERETCDLGEATFAVVCIPAGTGWHSAPPPLPGTAAVLSIGASTARAVVTGDAVAVRPVAALTLSYDARMLDHREAAAFLTALKTRLERNG